MVPCPNCNESLPAGRAHNARFCSWTCRNAFRQRRRRRRLAERLAGSPEELAAYRAEEKQRLKKYRPASSPKTRQSYEERRAKRRPLEQAWRKNNPDKVRLAEQRNKDMRRGLPATLTLADWRRALEYFQNRCAYCGNQPERFHKEHFIPAVLGGGLTPDNIVAACPRCNARKQKKHPADWLAGRPEVYERVTRYLNEYVRPS
jgi:5-methylcytosine-specific restriction endonuclease McrA